MQYFTEADREAFEKALHAGKSRAKDNCHGKAIDLALEVYRRHFPSGITDDFAFGPSRIGWIVAANEGSCRHVIYSLEEFFADYDDTAAQEDDAVPAG